MSDGSNQDSLLDYFTELLRDDDIAVEDNPKVNAKPSSVQLSEKPLQPPEVSSLRVQPKPVNKRPVAEQPVAKLAELEALKRKQLQALLTKRMPDLSIPVPEKTPQLQTEVKVKVLSPEQKIEQEMRIKLGSPELTEPALEQPAGELRESVNAVLEWAENGRPQWAQQRFDVLLFEVSGLTLAVPLIALGQIQNIGDELTPVFGQSDWFMGLLNTPNGQIRTLNTALFVMPEKYSDSFLGAAKYVISIDGLPWGLAVDSVNQPISLDPDEVKWRTQRTSRPWLAGTVKSAMCALIDIPQMGAMLQASEQKT
ncbi:chemotaxis protein CheW [Teredinibacter haidensis]|uniref:chemotaxis protein CheW n=1 Tax=Teredinibacter haidensis TaxID=2731755 RepID=UPI000948F4F1|nr:chemotaxis protein CheW [Teredinibacter haidensis]